MQNLYIPSRAADIAEACQTAGAAEPSRNWDGILETTLADGETKVVFVPDEALRLVFQIRGLLIGSIALKGRMVNPVTMALVLENADF